MIRVEHELGVTRCGIDSDDDNEVGCGGAGATIDSKEVDSHDVSANKPTNEVGGTDDG